MFKFIFFNVYEIFVVAACVLIAGAVVFALRHRAKLEREERDQDAK
ncbi:MAG: hypothetical protein AAFQ04_07400 [Pseudomonadota bacterium]